MSTPRRRSAMTTEPREAQYRHIRPDQRGPDRPGVAWELVGFVVLYLAAWVLLVARAGRQLGWW